MITVTSNKQCKIQAVKDVADYWTVVGISADSKISKQPFGKEEIYQGAFNRLKSINRRPTVSFETGIINQNSKYYDITCCLLLTRSGIYEAWSEPVHITLEEPLKQWLSMDNRKDVTLGSIIDPNNSSDWYWKLGCRTRTFYMSKAYRKCYTNWIHEERDIKPVIPAPLKKFKGVQFLDIQYPLINQSGDFCTSIWNLAKGLAFDVVVLVEARGFLFATEFMANYYPIVMARKRGKLPGECISVEYKKEYGRDTICIAAGSIKPGSKVLVIDDVIATGGSVKAVERLVQKCDSEVVGFLVPYIIENNNELISDWDHRYRYICTQIEASNGESSLPQL